MRPLRQWLWSLLLSKLCSLGFADQALVLGDSWAQYSLQTLQEQCLSITSMVNRGIAGSTAEQWAAGEGCPPANSLCCQADGRTCSVADVSFNDSFRNAWVSIGGNDFFNIGCSSDPAKLSQIQTHIEEVVSQLQRLSPQTKIILTGYSVPSGPLDWHPDPACSEHTALHPLNSAVKAAAEAQDVEYVDVSYVMGGNATHYSLPEFFADSIHLNLDGYRVLWEHPPLQAAMQCIESQSVSGSQPVAGARCGILSAMLSWMR